MNTVASFLAEKLCLFITPANPFPFEMPEMSTFCPTSKTSETFTTAPGSNSKLSSTSTSKTISPGSELYFLK